MAYQNVSWGPFTCPANTSQYPSNWFTVSGGTIVSVGFQNQGLVTSFYASQVFATNATACNVQVVNTGSAPVQWSAWAVVDTGSGPSVTATNAQVTNQTL